MGTISSQTIEEAVYNLVKTANIKMEAASRALVCDELSSSNDEESKNFLPYFLKNLYLADKNRRPICQDTGQVLVFIKLNQNICLSGKPLQEAIDNAVAKCYTENFLRKSVTSDAIFDRQNTQNNTPAIIYTEFGDSEGIEINVLIKGGGAENKSALMMLSPTANEGDIIEEAAKLVSKAGKSACPPYFLGIGIGGTADKALVMSKKAFFEGNQTDKQRFLAEKMKDFINAYTTTTGFEKSVVDVKILTAPTHIACMPVGVSFNCHALRHGRCHISQSGEITYFEDKTPLADCEIQLPNDIKKINSSDVQEIKSVKSREKVLISGKIYTARDAAHKRILNYIANKKPLPFELKDKIIFYAGPCPKNDNEIIGPVGPTTSGRMDKFSEQMAKLNILATIGKGERNPQTEEIFKENEIKYFTVYGGISNCLASCVKSANMIAFEDLGAEAVYELEVVDFPVVCEF